MRLKSLKISNPLQIILGSGDHNIFNVLSQFNKHKYILHAKMKGHSIEGFTDDSTKDSESFFTSIGGIIIITISLILWILALIVTIKYFNSLPVWAQILSILGLVGFGGPFLTLIVVYIAKSMGQTKSSAMGQNNFSYTMGKRSMFLG